MSPAAGFRHDSSSVVRLMKYGPFQHRLSWTWNRTRWSPVPGQGGRPLSDSVYSRARDKARDAALIEAEATSPLGERPYDLRHARLSIWLNAGVEPPRVAERGQEQRPGVAPRLRRRTIKRHSTTPPCAINPGFRDQTVVCLPRSVFAAPVVFDGLLEPFVFQVGMIYDQVITEEYAIAGLRRDVGAAPPFDVEPGQIRWLPAALQREGCPTCSPS